MRNIGPAMTRAGSGGRGRGRDARVPFVRRCRLEFADGRAGSAFLVNINVDGAYVAHDDLPRNGKGAAEAGPTGQPMPRVGESVRCRFQLPGRAAELEVRAIVSWLNPRQQHPVHSLPPGFLLTFEAMDGPERTAIEQLVREYLSAQPALQG
jgi:hypothetical protein